ncbi:hypothetical protein DIPPA_16398 [Diplonema papillatum]|nr:hypothetical protein DIPPA_16398 [Diplonema papillatum]
MPLPELPAPAASGDEPKAAPRAVVESGRPCSHAMPRARSVLRVLPLVDSALRRRRQQGAVAARKFAPVVSAAAAVGNCPPSPSPGASDPAALQPFGRLKLPAVAKARGDSNAGEQRRPAVVVVDLARQGLAAEDFPRVCYSLQGVPATEEVHVQLGSIFLPRAGVAALKKVVADPATGVTRVLFDSRAGLPAASRNELNAAMAEKAQLRREKRAHGYCTGTAGALRHSRKHGEPAQGTPAGCLMDGGSSECQHGYYTGTTRVPRHSRHGEPAQGVPAGSLIAGDSGSPECQHGYYTGTAPAPRHSRHCEPAHDAGGSSGVRQRGCDGSSEEDGGPPGDRPETEETSNRRPGDASSSSASWTASSTDRSGADPPGSGGLLAGGRGSTPRSEGSVGSGSSVSGCPREGSRQRPPFDGESSDPEACRKEARRGETSVAAPPLHAGATSRPGLLFDGESSGPEACRKEARRGETSVSALLLTDAATSRPGFRTWTEARRAGALEAGRRDTRRECRRQESSARWGLATLEAAARRRIAAARLRGSAAAGAAADRAAAAAAVARRLAALALGEADARGCLDTRYWGECAGFLRVAEGLRRGWVAGIEVAVRKLLSRKRRACWKRCDRRRREREASDEKGKSAVLLRERQGRTRVVEEMLLARGMVREQALEEGMVVNNLLAEHRAREEEEKRRIAAREQEIEKEAQAAEEAARQEKRHQALQQHGQRQYFVSVEDRARRAVDHAKTGKEACVRASLEAIEAAYRILSLAKKTAGAAVRHYNATILTPPAVWLRGTDLPCDPAIVFFQGEAQALVRPGHRLCSEMPVEWLAQWSAAKHEVERCVAAVADAKKAVKRLLVPLLAAAGQALAAAGFAACAWCDELQAEADDWTRGGKDCYTELRLPASKQAIARWKTDVQGGFVGARVATPVVANRSILQKSPDDPAALAAKRADPDAALLAEESKAVSRPLLHLDTPFATVGSGTPELTLVLPKEEAVEFQALADSLATLRYENAADIGGKQKPFIEVVTVELHVLFSPGPYLLEDHGSAGGALPSFLAVDVALEFPLVLQQKYLRLEQPSVLEYNEGVDERPLLTSGVLSESPVNTHVDATGRVYINTLPATFDGAVVSVEIGEGYTSEDQIYLRRTDFIWLDGTQIKVNPGNRVIGRLSTGFLRRHHPANSSFHKVPLQQRALQELFPHDFSPSFPGCVQKVILTDQAGADEVKALFEALKFVNLSSDPAEGVRTVNLRLVEVQRLSSSSLTVTVDVNPRDDPTTWTFPDKKVMFRAAVASDLPASLVPLAEPNACPVFPSGHIQDVDTVFFSGGHLRVSLSNARSGDRLFIFAKNAAVRDAAKLNYPSTASSPDLIPVDPACGLRVKHGILHAKKSLASLRKQNAALSRKDGKGANIRCFELPGTDEKMKRVQVWYGNDVLGIATFIFAAKGAGAATAGGTGGGTGGGKTALAKGQSFRGNKRKQARQDSPPNNPASDGGQSGKPEQGNPSVSPKGAGLKLIKYKPAASDEGDKATGAAGGVFSFRKQKDLSPTPGAASPARGGSRHASEALEHFYTSSDTANRRPLKRQKSAKCLQIPTNALVPADDPPTADDCVEILIQFMELPYGVASIPGIQHLLRSIGYSSVHLCPIEGQRSLEAELLVGRTVKKSAQIPPRVFAIADCSNTLLKEKVSLKVTMSLMRVPPKHCEFSYLEGSGAKRFAPFEVVLSEEGEVESYNGGSVVVRIVEGLTSDDILSVKDGIEPDALVFVPKVFAASSGNAECLRLCSELEEEDQPPLPSADAAGAPAPAGVTEPQLGPDFAEEVHSSGSSSRSSSSSSSSSAGSATSGAGVPAQAEERLAADPGEEHSDETDELLPAEFAAEKEDPPDASEGSAGSVRQRDASLEFSLYPESSTGGDDAVGTPQTNDAGPTKTTKEDPGRPGQPSGASSEGSTMTELEDGESDRYSEAWEDDQLGSCQPGVADGAGQTPIPGNDVAQHPDASSRQQQQAGDVETSRLPPEGDASAPGGRYPRTQRRTSRCDALEVLVHQFAEESDPTGEAAQDPARVGLADLVAMEVSLQRPPIPPQEEGGGQRRTSRCDALRDLVTSADQLPFDGPGSVDGTQQQHLAAVERRDSPSRRASRCDALKELIGGHVDTMDLAELVAMEVSLQRPPLPPRGGGEGKFDEYEENEDEARGGKLEASAPPTQQDAPRAASPPAGDDPVPPSGEAAPPVQTVLARKAAQGNPAPHRNRVGSAFVERYREICEAMLASRRKEAGEEEDPGAGRTGSWQVVKPGEGEVGIAVVGYGYIKVMFHENGPPVYRREALQVLRNVTYTNSSNNPETLEKLFQFSLRDKERQTASRAFVKMTVQCVNDPTVILLPSDKLHYRQCTTAQDHAHRRGFLPIAPLGRSCLHDPDTDDFCKGFLIVESVGGVTKVDTLGFLSADQQIEEIALFNKACGDAVEKQLDPPIVHVGEKIEGGEGQALTVGSPTGPVIGRLVFPKNACAGRDLAIHLNDRSTFHIDLPLMTVLLNCVYFTNDGTWEPSHRGSRLYRIRVSDGKEEGKTMLTVNLQPPLVHVAGMQSTVTVTEPPTVAAPAVLLPKAIASVPARKTLAEGWLECRLVGPGVEETDLVFLHVKDPAYTVTRDTIAFNNEYVARVTAGRDWVRLDNFGAGPKQRVDKKRLQELVRMFCYASVPAEDLKRQPPAAPAPDPQPPPELCQPPGDVAASCKQVLVRTSDLTPEPGGSGVEVSAIRVFVKRVARPNAGRQALRAVTALFRLGEDTRKSAELRASVLGTGKPPALRKRTVGEHLVIPVFPGSTSEKLLLPITADVARAGQPGDM